MPNNYGEADTGERWFKDTSFWRKVRKPSVNVRSNMDSMWKRWEVGFFEESKLYLSHLTPLLALTEGAA